MIKKTIKKDRIKNNYFISWKIIRKSINPRDKNNIHYNYIVDVEVKDENTYPKLKMRIENNIQVKKVKSLP